MNLLLLHPSDFFDRKTVRLNNRRFEHLLKTLKVEPGTILKAGLINGSIGDARVLSINSTTVELETNLSEAPPPPLPVTLILALPRPKVLARVIRNITILGVKRLHLINSWRVEKSYWQSPLLDSDKIEKQLISGLEQAIDTTVPEIYLHKLFKPFVEDELEEIARGSHRYVAHPGAESPAPKGLIDPTCLVIGPEGGFIPYEIVKLQEAGFQTVTLGPRILNVELAISSLLSR